MRVGFDKARVCLAQAGEASNEKGVRERRGRRRVGEFLSQGGRLNGWEREKNGVGGEKEGGGGVTCRGLTACEYGLTSPVRLQVSSAGLEETKIKPRNVNLFSIVTVEEGQKKSAYIHIK